MNERKLYLNKAELAAELGLTKRGIEDMMRQHKIPFLALGHRTVRFHWPSVEKALAKFESKAIGEEQP